MSGKKLKFGNTPERDCTLRRGMVLGGYEVLKLISRQGIGEMYLVKNQITKKRYALKLLPPILASSDDFQPRFKAATAELKDHIHENLVHIRHTGHESEFLDFYYIVMDYLESPQGFPLTLEDRLKSQRRLTEFQAKKVAMQICDALNYAHSFKGKGFIHSNLKPANILFNTNLRVKLSDFETVEMIGNKYLREIIKQSLNSSIAEALTPENNPKPSTTILEMEDSEITGTVSLRLLNEKLRFWEWDKWEKLGVKMLKKRIKSLFKRLVLGAKKKNKQADFIPQTDSSSDDNPNASFIASILDTYDYMSPEQKAGSKPTAKSNIYSFGLILYRMLTGCKMVGCWDLPSSSGCDPEWDSIITKCLKREPEERYNNIEEVKQDISKVLIKKRISKSMVSLIAATAVVILVITVLSVAIFKNKHSQISPDNLVGDSSYRTKFDIAVKPQGASVSISNQGYNIFSIEKMPGKEIQLDLKPGVYELSINLPGYKSFYKKIIVDPENHGISLELIKADNPIEKNYVYLKDLTSPKKDSPWIIPVIDINMLPVSSGNFIMGNTSDDKKPDDLPPTPKTINYHFWISKSEITQGQYDEIMWKKPSYFRFSGMDAPVERISWKQAVEFCNNLTEREREAERLPANYAYRLPTETEWEYCCRAGIPNNGEHKTVRELDKFAWIISNSDKRTHQVAQKMPNPWGLYDMQGNVWEWTMPETQNSKDTIYILRGGSWSNEVDKSRCSTRQIINSPYFSDSTTGFRIVLAPVMPE
jgi:serine/threonine protein kinase